MAGHETEETINSTKQQTQDEGLNFNKKFTKVSL